MAFYLYTETAFHHEGDIDYIKKLIDASKEAGANGVKFQVLMDLNNLTSSKHVLFDKLLSCIFSKNQWIEIFKYTAGQGLDVIMMPLDEGAFDLINESGVDIKYLDLHSVSFYDHTILSMIKESKIPLILGVGGRTVEEIKDKQSYFGEQFQVIMVGFQSYPSKLEDIKMGRINLYKNLFPNHEIGYADHSSFDNEHAIKSNEYAYLMGATIFEKHITVDEGKERLDYQSALGSDGVKVLVDNLKYLDSDVLKYDETSLLKIEEPELSYRNRQKVAVAKNNLSKGTEITEMNITFKMTDNGKGEKSIDALLGKVLAHDIEKDVAVLKDDVE